MTIKRLLSTAGGTLFTMAATLLFGGLLLLPQIMVQVVLSSFLNQHSGDGEVQRISSIVVTGELHSLFGAVSAFFALRAARGIFREASPQHMGVFISAVILAFLVATFVLAPKIAWFSQITLPLIFISPGWLLGYALNFNFKNARAARSAIAGIVILAAMPFAVFCIEPYFFMYHPSTTTLVYRPALYGGVPYGDTHFYQGGVRLDHPLPWEETLGIKVPTHGIATGVTQAGSENASWIVVNFDRSTAVKIETASDSDGKRIRPVSRETIRLSDADVAAFASVANRYWLDGFSHGQDPAAQARLTYVLDGANQKLVNGYSVVDQFVELLAKLDWKNQAGAELKPPAATPQRAGPADIEVGKVTDLMLPNSIPLPSSGVLVQHSSLFSPNVTSWRLVDLTDGKLLHFNTISDGQSQKLNGPMMIQPLGQAELAVIQQQIDLMQGPTPDRGHFATDVFITITIIDHGTTKKPLVLVDSALQIAIESL